MRAVRMMSETPMPDPPGEVLYEERGVLIFNKPGGLLTQGPPGIPSLEWHAKRWLKARDEKPGKVYLAVTHRLDRPVSGAIVLAKHVRAANRIQAQFRSRDVRKIYWALVEGVLPDDDGEWVDWMRKIPDEAKSEVVDAEAKDAKRADLRFRVKQRFEDRTWLEIELGTGRTHQIRLQAAARGFPIVGDALYGATTEFGPQTVDLRERWIALHAREVAFAHPVLEQRVEVTAGVAEWWNEWIEAAE